jgi:AcrR family transcriptional regulator
MNKRSGKESKRKILGAATRVFSKYGYRGTSMRMLAKAAGMSLGGLYLYFRNKEDLYGTVIGNRLNDLTEETREKLKGLQDPAEALRTFISMRINYAKKHRELILVLGREQALAFGVKAKKKFFRDQRRVIEEIVRNGIAKGIFMDCDAGEVAKVIVCALRGFVLSIIIEPDALFSPEECSKLILKGILRKENGGE